MNLNKIMYAFFGIIMFVSFGGVIDVFAVDPETQKLDILRDWRGDYPVSQLHRLPEEMKLSKIGYINNEAIFTAVWQAFRPGDKTPEINFRTDLVLFARNTVFFNRIGISAVLFQDGGARVLAMETLSALPIEDRVGLALAVIPAKGVGYLAVGDQKIPVVSTSRNWPTDPLNATYWIAGRNISLQKGQSEHPVAQGSNVRMVTKIVKPPVYGDLDGDGNKDAVLILVQTSGGSGTFYYITAAINIDGQYCGTNAVLLGDRISLEEICIAHGVIVARYKDRALNEPMTAVPTLEQKTYLRYELETLRAIKSTQKDEQVLAGLVAIGHEVRSFRPCSNDIDHWIAGDSPALAEIIETYNEAMHGCKPYAPLLMVLAGKIVDAPHDGFGSDHGTAFYATHLIDIQPRQDCRASSIPVQSR